MAERPDLARLRKSRDQEDRALIDYIDTLEGRLRAATERCTYHPPLDKSYKCSDCQADLALLDGTPEPTQ